MKKLDQKGQGLTEYILLVLLIGVVSIGAVKSLGTEINSKIKQARDSLNRDATTTR